VQQYERGISAIAGPNALRLSTSAKCSGENFTTISEFKVSKGDRIPFVLTWYQSFDTEPSEVNPDDALEETLMWWNNWSGRCTYKGPYRDIVQRSLITLKALTFGPSGGIIAAPTTSLPEKIGGIRNWDYRYCWLRDATLALLSLLDAGYADEAAAWREWLLRAVAGDTTNLQIMYGIGGERRLTEYEVPWLEGYEKSSPVRIGNTASNQFQLDVYGEVCDALHQARVMGVKSAAAGWALERALIEFVEKNWRKPDEGLWEVRGPRQHFTHSKIMAWVAIDRAIKSAERFNLDGPVDRWRLLRSDIHDTVCRKGFDADRNTFVQAFGSKALDASLLMIPLVGFLPPSDPRVRGTITAIETNLVQDGFVWRYDTYTSQDGLPPGEGAFLPCTFWLADNYALIGERERATNLFEKLCNLCNDVGLLSEEYDSAQKRLVGNFPQAFSHIGLVNTAINLSNLSQTPTKQRTQS
jgi:GH15 family glucan-1,4-alpha-glucosidase